MKIVQPGYEILRPYALSDENKLAIYRAIELPARTCYKSEARITSESAAPMVAALVKNGHEAMLEHANMTVKFIVDRGVSHELVRHREASFAQESTRYCNYGAEKFGHDISFVNPCGGLELDPKHAAFFEKDDPEVCADWLGHQFLLWKQACTAAEQRYFALLDQGVSPQMARGVLPNALKTEVVLTANIREWRHILRLRAANATGPAHPQMLEVMVPLLITLSGYMPELFLDILEEGKARWPLFLRHYFGL